MKDKLLEFMNRFIDSEGIDMIDEEMFELERRYGDMFGHGIPREMFPPRISDDDIKIAILRCIETGRDELVKILQVEDFVGGR